MHRGTRNWRGLEPSRCVRHAQALVQRSNRHENDCKDTGRCQHSQNKLRLQTLPIPGGHKDLAYTKMSQTGTSNATGNVRTCPKHSKTQNSPYAPEIKIPKPPSVPDDGECQYTCSALLHYVFSAVTDSIVGLDKIA